MKKITELSVRQGGAFADFLLTGKDEDGKEVFFAPPKRGNARSYQKYADRVFKKVGLKERLRFEDRPDGTIYWEVLYP